MQTETFLERFPLKSQTDGNPRTLLFDPSTAALNAKVLRCFLEVIEADDSNMKIWVEYEDSADGVAWNSFATTLIDTAGPSNDPIMLGVYPGTSPDTFGAWLRLKVTAEQIDRTTPAEVRAIVSIKGVWKPF